ncbi:MAG: mRNA surveillance protein pelota [Candidatus Bathyarchaeota archaeon]|nr:MAG: mRNA surveillance protein pelota [Candidatus Bathyarchaeota archaeon]
MKTFKMRRGVAKVSPDNLDDLWHLYNIIHKGDEVHARTTREKKVDEQYARPKRGKRVRVLLGVRVESVLWDKTLNRLRIHGIVCKAPEKISVKGEHHTLNVTVNKPITIVKSKWSKHQKDRLRRASQVEVTPIVVMSMDNEEYCIAVLRQYGVEAKVEEKTRLPGKLEAEKRVGAIQGFFKSALKALKDVWIGLRCPIVIIGPGFMKGGFVKYINREASDVAGAVVDVKGVNSGGLAGIEEALRSGVFTKTLKHVRVAEENSVVEEVLARLGKGRSDVTYGFEMAEKISSFGAVEKLLLADSTLREASDEERIALEKLMRDVENRGGQISVISTEHEAGVKLLGLGGVAALLRFQTDYLP